MVLQLAGITTKMVDEHRPREKRKTKSAPPRFSSRDDVWKDIRDWAKPNSIGTNNAIGAQLKDNVTEQRMLESRLLDLSKERYKFNVQVAWQRKTFVDKQRNKAGQMKELLLGIEAVQIKANKQNQASQLNARTQQYHDLKMKAYADRRIRGNSAKNFLTQHKPICIEPVFVTQKLFPSGQVSRSMYCFGPKQTIFPDVLTLSSGPSNRLSNRSSSVPPRISKQQNTVRGNTDTINRKICSSAGSIPRYLQYRSVFDRRFSNLEQSLCEPVTSQNTEGQTSLRSLLSGLPVTPKTLP